MIAAILSLACGPLGQLYAGRGRRFFVLAIVTLVLLPLVALIAISLPGGRLAFGSLLVAYVCWPIFLIVDAFRCARHAHQKQLRWYQRWWIYPLAAVGFLMAFIVSSEFTKAFVANEYFVPTGPMNPTIKNGDTILTSRIVSAAEAIDYGNVVVFHSEGPGSPLYAMRVIAIGGDTIEIKDDSVILNGKAIDEPYANFDTDRPPHNEMANMRRITIPANHFFALGDARRRSWDSRFLGAIPNTHYRGMALRIIWSRPRELIIDSQHSAKYRTKPIAWERVGMEIR